MGQLGDHEEDFVRAFFRRHVLELDDLLDSVYNTYSAAVDGQTAGSDVSSWVLEANRIFTVSFKSLCIN